MAQRANLEAILDSVSEGIFALNHRLQILNLNLAFTQITGYARDEVLGRPITELLQTSSCDLEELLRAALKTGEPSHEREIELRAERGQHRTVILRAHPLRDEGGILRGLVVVMHDVTETRQLRKALQERHQFHRIIGKSHQMQEIYDLIEDLRESHATVLIQGESGTGKELVAAAIHYSSTRKDGPFIKVNCAALAENLLESELFGHVKGAFTGALHDKVGRFELADGGTIFLDEIGDLTPDLQIKLLRVLQEREIERVGEARPRPVDTRVIAATHRDLLAAIRQGTFREDLYYRLHVVPIHLPPLRDRKGDIPLLVQHFIEKFNRTTHKNIRDVSPEVLDRFMEYHWPGNIRELENAMEYAFVRCHGDTILLKDLPRSVREPAVETPTVRTATSAARQPQGRRPLTQERLLAALQKTGWNKSKAARLLGVDRNTVWRKVKEYGLKEE